MATKINDVCSHTRLVCVSYKFSILFGYIRCTSSGPFMCDETKKFIVALIEMRDAPCASHTQISIAPLPTPSSHTIFHKKNNKIKNLFHSVAARCFFEILWHVEHFCNNLYVIVSKNETKKRIKEPIRESKIVNGTISIVSEKRIDFRILWNDVEKQQSGRALFHRKRCPSSLATRPLSPFNAFNETLKNGMKYHGFSFFFLVSQSPADFRREKFRKKKKNVIRRNQTTCGSIGKFNCKSNRQS